MPANPRPRGVIWVVRRSDVTVCKVIQWKLWAPLGHLSCPSKLWNSLIVLISLWSISIVGHESCPDLSLFCTGRCLFDHEEYEGLFREGHTCESVLCVCSCLTAALVIYSHDTDLTCQVSKIFTSVSHSDFPNCWKYLSFCSLGIFASCRITYLIKYKWMKTHLAIMRQSFSSLSLSPRAM